MAQVKRARSKSYFVVLYSTQSILECSYTTASTLLIHSYHSRSSTYLKRTSTIRSYVYQRYSNTQYVDLIYAGLNIGVILTLAVVLSDEQKFLAGNGERRS